MKAGWTEVALGEVCEINPTDERPSSDAPASFVPMAALDETEGRCVSEQTRPFAEVATGYTQFRRGDILVAKITPCFENGKIGAATIENELGVGSTEFHVVRPIDGILDSAYALHFLRREQVRQKGELRMTGSAGQRRVPAAFLRTLAIPLPPLDEQRRIARVFDVVASLRARQAVVRSTTLSLVDASFVATFGNPAINTGSWAVATIGEVGDVITGNTPPRANPANYGGGLGWVKNDDVRDDQLFVTRPTESLSEIGASRGRAVPPDSVLVTCISGSPSAIGRSALTAEKFAFNQQINAVVPHEADARFLCAQLRLLRDVLRKASTGGMKGLISKSSLKRVPLILPPQSTQQQFGRVFDAVATQLARCDCRGDRLEQLMGSIQNRAFNGEL